MLSFAGLVALVLVLFYGISSYRALSANIAAAKQSGIPYVVTPVWTFSKLWLITHRIWLRVLVKLPESWTQSWLKCATSPQVVALRAADVTL